MKLLIQGSKLTLSIKSDEDFTTEQVVMAHQLATGNYQALFVDEIEYQNEVKSKEPDPKEAVVKSIQDIIKAEGKQVVDAQVTDVQKGDRVSVEVLCPFCGHTGKAGTRWGNSFCKCPQCEEKLFNRFATEFKGETNSYGCHYVADEPMVFKYSKDEYSEMFKEEKGDLPPL